MSNPSGEASYEIRIVAPSAPSEEQMRTIGAVAGVYGWGAPELSRLVAPEALSHDTFFSPGQQARLDTRLDSPDLGFAVAPGDVGVRALRAFQREGLTTVRDVLVVGSEFLLGIRNFLTKSLERTQEVLLRHFPEVPLPETSDAATTARFCPSLHQVTWLALGSGVADGLWYSGVAPARNLSLRDILDRPFSELELVENTHADPDRKKTSGAQQIRLRQEAELYERAFLRAQEAYAQVAEGQN